MMISWRKQQTLSTKAAIDTVGNPYIEYLKGLKGLPHPETAYFAYAAGMKSEVPRSYSPRQLCDMMSSFRSPLMACVYWVNATGMTHFYVITAISSDGSEEGTWIDYNDPLDEEPQSRQYPDFMSAMESAVANKSDLTAQILHY
jgi:hypothetical protein